MLKVRAIAEAQRERLKSAEVEAQFAHHRVSGEKDCTTVDATGEAAADRFRFRDAFEPFSNFVFQRSYVVMADRVKIG